MKYEVEIYEDAARFLDSLSDKLEAKARRAIKLLQEFGYTLTEPHSKKLQSVEDLYELRVKVGSDICRMFYFHFKDKIYVVTSGYIKKSDKIDVTEIKKAVKIMKAVREK